MYLFDSCFKLFAYHSEVTHYTEKKSIKKNGSLGMNIFLEIKIKFITLSAANIGFLLTKNVLSR